jgi:hypothetical protein
MQGRRLGWALALTALAAVGVRGDRVAAAAGANHESGF